MTRLALWLRRFRHRRGYGIHSPSAFAFVTGVIYETGEYYAYRPLCRHYGLGGYSPAARRRLKHARLLFRLANYVQPHTIVVPQHTPQYIQAHLQAGCLAARVTECTLPADVMMLCNGSRSLIVVPRLYDQLPLFQEIRQRPEVVVTYDLYDFGLAFFDQSKQKQHYIINYESIY